MTHRKQRDKGTGSVYRNTRGQWVASIEAGWTERGTRHRITLKGRTQAEVRARLHAKQTQIAKMGFPTVAGSATVKGWADAWLASRQRVVRPGTFIADRSAVRRWIIPVIGHRRLDLLTPTDVRLVASRQENAGLALPSIQRTHAVLSKLLTDAVAEGYLVPQRVRETPGLGNGFSTRQALDVEAATAILKIAAGRPDSSRWIAALLQGLRPAEALGLTWEMIDFDAATMTLAWQLKALPYVVPRHPDSGFSVPRGFEARHLQGAYHLVRPKTRAGIRVVPLVPCLAQALAQWRAMVPTNALGLVWSRSDGTPRTPEFDRQQWYDVVAEAGAQITLPDGTKRRPLLYEARHTAATLLLSNGIDEATIKAILGHSTILSTQAYLHTDLSRTRAALEASARLLGLSSVGQDLPWHGYPDGYPGIMAGMTGPLNTRLMSHGNSHA